MQLISIYNKKKIFLWCIFHDFFSKYAWIVPLKDKKDVTITKALENVLDDSGCELNNIWVDRGS